MLLAARRRLLRLLRRCVLQRADRLLFVDCRDWMMQRLKSGLPGLVEAPGG